MGCRFSLSMVLSFARFVTASRTLAAAMLSTRANAVADVVMRGFLDICARWVLRSSFARASPISVQENSWSQASMMLCAWVPCGAQAGVAFAALALRPALLSIIQFNPLHQEELAGT